MFAPMKGKETWRKGELLSELGQRMLMASETGGGVWFRNRLIRELNNDGTFYRWNVITDYQFSHEIGRAMCRESVCQTVYLSEVTVSLKKKIKFYLPFES